VGKNVLRTDTFGSGIDQMELSGTGQNRNDSMSATGQAVD